MPRKQPDEISADASYICEEYYEKLLAGFKGWQSPDREVPDPALRDACRRLLEKEARHLQQADYEAWLALYAEQCLYWVPAEPVAGDPRKVITIAFDDRRRLEDRVYRLQLACAWSQQPPSRTVRMVGNVEVFTTPEKNVFMVRSNMLTSEFRIAETRIWNGWCCHRIRLAADNFSIQLKQVNLVDCDQNLRNPSIIF